MEIVFSAIIGALGKLGEFVIKDGYETLKEVIKKKLGKDSGLSEAIRKLEAKPDSYGRREILKEELVTVGADQDSDIMQAAEGLLVKLKALPGGQQFIRQIIMGHSNIVSGTGDINFVFGKPKE